jgi:hypothetical protein
VGLGADLDQWQTVVPRSTFLTLLDVAYGADTFVVAGETSTQNGVDAELFTSRDGVHWTRQLSGVNGVLFGTVHGPNGFVTVGGSYVNSDFRDLILTSSDGTTWTRRPAGISNHLFDVCYGNGSFVAVGMRGAVVTSSNGVVWSDRSLRPLDPGLNFLGVDSGGGMFVAVGSVESPVETRAVVLTSTNGVQWTRRTLAPPRLRDVAYGNGRFVAVGEFDRIWYSTNGATWSASATGIYDHLYAINFIEGRFVAVGENGWVTSSTDGVHWILHRRGTGEGLFGIAYGNGSYVAVDYDGAILRTRTPNRPPSAVVDVSPSAQSFSIPPDYVVISPDGRNARVSLSGAGSSDPDGDALDFAWFREAAEIARTMQTTVLFVLGEHNLALRVSDRIETDTHDFRIHVITASEALDHVIALLEESALPRRDKQPLLMLLRGAQRPFEDGDTESGLHHLDRLQRKIDARLGATNPDLARALTAALNDIRAAFEPC